jgi:hypothetical protein
METFHDIKTKLILPSNSKKLISEHSVDWVMLLTIQDRHKEVCNHFYQAKYINDLDKKIYLYCGKEIYSAITSYNTTFVSGTGLQKSSYIIDKEYVIPEEILNKLDVLGIDKLLNFENIENLINKNKLNLIDDYKADEYVMNDNFSMVSDNSIFERTIIQKRPPLKLVNINSAISTELKHLIRPDNNDYSGSFKAIETHLELMEHKKTKALEIYKYYDYYTHDTLIFRLGHYIISFTTINDNTNSQIIGFAITGVYRYKQDKILSDNVTGIMHNRFKVELLDKNKLAYLLDYNIIDKLELPKW